MNFRLHRWAPDERAALIVFTPVILAAALGWFRAGTVARELSLPYAVLFWLCIWLGYWVVAGAATLALERVSSSLRARPWLVLLLGGLCASAASAFYLQPYLGVFEGLLSAERQLRIAEFGALPLSTRVPAAMLNSMLGVVVWVSVNLLALRIDARPARTVSKGSAVRAEPEVAIERVMPVETALPIETAVPVVVATEIAPAPFFDGLLDEAVRPQDIVAIQAQDHYVMVYTAKSKQLILYRFRNAVSELASVPGAQVHRSWWISEAAVAASPRKSGSSVFKVRDDLIVPVGRSWREQAKALRGKH